MKTFTLQDKHVAASLYHSKLASYNYYEVDVSLLISICSL